MLEHDALSKAPESPRNKTKFDKLVSLLKKEHQHALSKATRTVKSQNESLSDEVQRLRRMLAEWQDNSVVDEFHDADEKISSPAEKSEFSMSDTWAIDIGSSPEAEDPEPKSPPNISIDEGEVFEIGPDIMPSPAPSAGPSPAPSSSSEDGSDNDQPLSKQMKRASMPASVQQPAARRGSLMLPGADDRGPVKSASFTLAPAPTPPPKKKRGDDLALKQPKPKIAPAPVRPSPNRSIKTPPPTTGLSVVSIPGVPASSSSFPPSSSFRKPGSDEADSSSSSDEVRPTGRLETSDELDFGKAASMGAPPSSKSLPMDFARTFSDGSTRGSRRKKGRSSMAGDCRRSMGRGSLEIPNMGGLRSSLKKSSSHNGNRGSLIQMANDALSFSDDEPGERRVTLSMMSDDSDEEEEDDIQLQPCWQKMPQKFGAVRTNDTSIFLRRSMQQMTELFVDDSTCDKIMKRCVVSPSSIRRLLWDVIGMILIAYDLVTIPLQAFDLDENTFIVCMTWVSSIFWTMDIPLTFVTGYHSEGVLEMLPKLITRHYLKGWFTFDITVITVDWLIQVAGTLSSTMAGSSVAYMRIGRTLRFLRLLRLVRLVKVHGVLSDLMERVNSESYVIVLGIGRLVLFILMLNHIIACAWYGIGSLDKDDETSWVWQNSLQNQELGYRYATSLHWSLTQFTPASMEVVPENTIERVFCVLVLVFAMVTFSSFISSITNAMTQLRNLNSDKLERFSLLRRFLGENKISAALCARIWGCLQQVMDRSKRRIHEDEVPILTLLPWSLKADLQEEIYAPVLCVHPFFNQFNLTYPASMRKVFQNTLSELSLGVGQELFAPGESAGNTYFAFGGMMSYNKDEKHEQLPDTLLIPGQWAAEAGIWIRWKHVGQMIATTHCELLVVSIEKLHDVIASCQQPKRYARRFCYYFKMHPDSLCDVFVDLPVLNVMAEEAFNGKPDEEDMEMEAKRSLRSGFSVLSKEMVEDARKHLEVGNDAPNGKFSLGKLLKVLNRNKGKLGSSDSLEDDESSSGYESSELDGSSSENEGLPGGQSSETLDANNHTLKAEDLNKAEIKRDSEDETQDRIDEMKCPGKASPLGPPQNAPRRVSGLASALSGALHSLTSAVGGSAGAGAPPNADKQTKRSKSKHRSGGQADGSRRRRDSNQSTSSRRRGSKESATPGMRRKGSTGSMSSQMSTASRKKDGTGTASAQGLSSWNFFRPKDTVNSRDSATSDAPKKFNFRNILSKASASTEDFSMSTVNPAGSVNASSSPQVRSGGSSGAALVFS